MHVAHHFPGQQIDAVVHNSWHPYAQISRSKPLEFYLKAHEKSTLSGGGGGKKKKRKK
jgi:hypothetical protein